jgi:hypothetical protein
MLLLAVACFLTTLAGAQVTITTAQPALIGFVDISAAGGTAITGVGDDTEHNITTTIGNSLFPAGPVRVSSNGLAIAGVSAGSNAFTNGTIPPTGAPGSAIAGGAGYAIPYWDDLQAQPDAGATTIWWREMDNVLIIMWKDIGHFSVVAGQQITFELQVFGDPTSCGASIQYLYSDTTFGGTQAGSDNGASATVGYASAFNTFVTTNAPLSFNSATITPATVVSVGHSAAIFSASSPLGPGSLLLQYAPSACTAAQTSYLLAVTLNQGTFPNGWLFGVDIPVSELVDLASIGAPFTGAGASFSIGPILGVPPITFYGVVLSFNVEGILSGHSNHLSYTVP